MGKSPVSPQIHKKCIKIWNNCYKATSRQQKKTPILQGNRLSSLKWGRKEDGDIKREKLENFWIGGCAPREEGGPETGGVPGHNEAPFQGAQGRATESQKTGQNRDLEGRKQTWTVFPTQQWARGTERREGHEPLQRTRSPLGQHTNPTSAHSPCGTEGRPGCPRVARHANSASVHNTYGAKGGPGCWERGGIQTSAVHTNLTAQRLGLRSQKKNTQALQQWVQAGETKQEQYKSHDADGGPGARGKVHTSPETQTGAQGAKAITQEPHSTEGGPGSGDKPPSPTSRMTYWAGLASQGECTQAPWHSGWAQGTEGSPHVSTKQKAQARSQEKIHTSPCLANFSQQCRAGQGNRSTSKDPRDK